MFRIFVSYRFVPLQTRAYYTVFIKRVDRSWIWRRCAPSDHWSPFIITIFFLRKRKKIKFNGFYYLFINILVSSFVVVVVVFVVIVVGSRLKTSFETVYTPHYYYYYFIGLYSLLTIQNFNFASHICCRCSGSCLSCAIEVHNVHFKKRIRRVDEREKQNWKKKMERRKKKKEKKQSQSWWKQNCLFYIHHCTVLLCILFY